MAFQPNPLELHVLHILERAQDKGIPVEPAMDGGLQPQDVIATTRSPRGLTPFELRVLLYGEGFEKDAMPAHLDDPLRKLEGRELVQAEQAPPREPPSVDIVYLTKRGPIRVHKYFRDPETRKLYVQQCYEDKTPRFKSVTHMARKGLRETRWRITAKGLDFLDAMSSQDSRKAPIHNTPDKVHEAASPELLPSLDWHSTNRHTSSQIAAGTKKPGETADTSEPRRETGHTNEQALPAKGKTVSVDEALIKLSEFAYFLGITKDAVRKVLRGSSNAPKPCINGRSGQAHSYSWNEMRSFGQRVWRKDIGPPPGRKKPRKNQGKA